MEILGVRIDDLNRSDALERVLSFSRANGQNTVFTPNPEMLVDAQTDEYFRTVLNSGSLNICDGRGIELVSGGKLTRIPGIDFMLDICALAEKEGRSVFLFGSGDDNVVAKAKEVLLTRFPNIKIVGFDKGLVISSRARDLDRRQPDSSHSLEMTNCGYDEGENDQILNQIIDSAPDILFVAFGHGKQEKWIYENLKHLPSIKIAMGVGGAFNVLSGKVPRAPRLFRALGLEWLWRLIIQPWRIGRIWKATFGFLYYYFRKKNKLVL